MELRTDNFKLALPGVSRPFPLGPCGFDSGALDDLTPQQLLESHQQLQIADSALYWARADIGAELVKRKSFDSMRAIIRDHEAGQLEFSFTATMESFFWGAAIPADLRRPELSYFHHVECGRCLGKDFRHEEFREWLEKAVDQKWSVKELRKQMRRKTRIEEKEVETDPFGFLSPIVLMVTKLGRRDFDKFEPDEKEALAKTVTGMIEQLKSIQSALSPH